MLFCGCVCAVYCIHNKLRFLFCFTKLHWCVSDLVCVQRYVCDLACVWGPSTGACSAHAEQRCGIVLGSLHHCTQTAAEQLFLIMEQSVVWKSCVEMSRQIFCVHTRHKCACVSCTWGLLKLICKWVLYLQENSLYLSPLPVCAQTARSTWLRQKVESSGFTSFSSRLQAPSAAVHSPKWTKTHLWLTSHYWTRCVKRTIKQLWSFITAPPDRKCIHSQCCLWRWA